MLFADAEMRARLGAAGAATIRSDFNSEVAGQLMAERIRELSSIPRAALLGSELVLEAQPS